MGDTAVRAEPSSDDSVSAYPLSASEVEFRALIINVSIILAFTDITRQLAIGRTNEQLSYAKRIIFQRSHFHIAKIMI